MGRKRKAGNRSPSGRKRKPTTALERETRVAPNDRVLERRRQFAWVRPPADKDGKPIDGNNGEVDQQVCDALGQLQVLGLLDVDGFDSADLRDVGREWGQHFTRLMRGERLTAKAQSYERQDRGQGRVSWTVSDQRFDAMDLALDRFERQVLAELIIQPEIGCWPDGQEFSPWVQGLIQEALLERGMIVRSMVFPNTYHRHLLETARQGLVAMSNGLSQWKKAA